MTGKNVFPVKYDGDECLKYIFPSMQKEVQRVIDKAKDNEQIKRIVVFGSSVTWNCGLGSDLDVAVFGNFDEDMFMKVYRLLKTDAQCDMDILHYEDIRSELLKYEIDTKGVEIYVNRF